MNNVKRVIAFILTFICINLFTETVNAFSMSSNIDKNVIEVGQEISYTVTFDEIILTSDFKLSYDNNVLEYIGSSTDNVDVNSSIDNNYVHVLYVDESGNGTNEIKLLFKAIKSFDTTDLKILEMNVHTRGSGISYSVDNASSLEEATKQILTIKTSTSNEKNNQITNEQIDTNVLSSEGQNIISNSSSIILPYAGMKKKAFVIVFILLILLTIFLGYKNIKFRKIFSILIFIFVMSKIIDAKAVSSNYVGMYNKIYGYQKIITIMPNEKDKDISYQKLIDYLNIDLSIDKVTNSNDERVLLTSNVATGNNVFFSNGDSYQIIVYGDVNCDGKVNSNDIAEIIENNLNLKQLTGINRKAANVANVDDKTDLLLNSEDIYKLKEYILNRLEGYLVDELPQELEITGISIKTEPSKTSYIKGENLDLTGGKITTTYEDGTTANVDMTASNVEIRGYNANQIGEQEITVTYANHAATFNVTVHNEITGLSIKTEPSKTSYIKGENLDLTGGKITATYEDGTTTNVDMTALNVGVSGYNANKIGEQEITVTYANHAATFNVIVIMNPTSVSLNYNNVILDDLDFTEEKENISLIATCEPNSSYVNTNITWESSDESIATVDQNGNVQMVEGGYGICTITARADNGEEANCNVTVRINDIITYDKFGEPIQVPARDGNGNINNAQSLAVITNKEINSSFYVVGIIDNTVQKQKLANLQVYKSDGTYIESARRWSNVLGHANGMTYNPITNKLFVLPRPDGSEDGIAKEENNNNGRLYRFNVDFSSQDYIPVIDTESLESPIGTDEEDYIESYARTWSIAYDESTMHYYMHHEGNIRVYNDEDAIKNDDGYDIDTSVSHPHTTQDIGAYNGFVLVIDYYVPTTDYLNDENYINIYRASDGEYLGRYVIDITGLINEGITGYTNKELESVAYDPVEEKFVLLFNKRSNTKAKNEDGNLVYKTELPTTAFISTTTEIKLDKYNYTENKAE